MRGERAATFLRKLLRLNGVKLAPGDDIFRFFLDRQELKDPLLDDVEEMVDERDGRQTWPGKYHLTVHVRALNPVVRAAAAAAARARRLTSAPPTADGAEATVYEEELCFHRAKHGWVASLGFPSEQTVPVVWDECASEVLRRLGALHGWEVAEGTDAIRFHLLDGNEVLDPTWRQLKALNAKHLPEELCLKDDTEHFLRVRLLRRDPAVPVPPKSKPLRRCRQATTPEPPGGDRDLAYSAKMEFWFWESDGGFTVSVDRPHSHRPGSSDKAPRLTETVGGEAMALPILRRLAAAHKARISPEADAVVFRLPDMSVVPDVSIAEAHANSKENLGDRAVVAGYEHLLIAFVRGPPRALGIPTCHYNPTGQAMGQVVQERLWFEATATGYVAGLVGRHTTANPYVVNVKDWGAKVKDVMAVLATLYGFAIKCKRNALRYELLGGHEIKNPTLRDVVKDWEENHVAEWADEIDCTYQLTVYVEQW